MAIVHVNGTALQPAIDAAQPWDEIVPSAGTYRGALHDFGKPLTFRGDGGVILDCPQGDGFVNFDVDRATVVIEGFDTRHGGAAYRFTGNCSGSRVANGSIPVVDFMVRNTSGVAGDDNGGNAFQFTKREGQAGAIAARGITVEDMTIRSCRAPSFDYTRDGGMFEVYGGVRDIQIRRVEGWDNVNIFESGKGAGDPDNADVLVEDSTFHGRPAPLTAATPTTSANGFFVRAMQGLTVRRNIFDLIDWWAFTLKSGVPFGGGLGAISLLDNTFRLAPGVNRIIAGDDLSSVTLDRSKIWTTGPTVLAESNGVRISDLAGLVARGFELHNAGFGLEPPADPCSALRLALASALASEGEEHTARQLAEAEIARLRAAITLARSDLDV